MGKYKRIFVNPRSNRNRIELDPTTSVDRNPLPAYTYGAGANETFPGIFPTNRGVAGTRGPIEIHKEGIGVAGDVSTPTFSSTSGGRDGKEIDFFKVGKKANDFVKKYMERGSMGSNNVTKAWINFQEGEPIPKNAKTKRGPKGGWYYWGQLSGRKYKESAEISSQLWVKPQGNYSKSGVVIPTTWKNCLINEDHTAPMQVVGLNSYGEFAMIRDRRFEDVGVLKHFMTLKKLVDTKKGKSDVVKIKERLEKDIRNTKLNPLQRQSALIYLTQLQTGFRIGSYTKTKGKIQSFGISTLLGKHVTTYNRDFVKFSFRGKDGNLHKRNIKSPILAAYIRNRKDVLRRKGKNPNNFRIFPDVSWKKSQKYLDSVCVRGGVSNLKQDKNTGKLIEHYTSHDFRRYRASEMANGLIAKYLSKHEAPKTEAQLKRLQIYVGKEVGNKVLHNTYTVALKKYITPLIWEPFKAPTTTELKGQKASTGVSHLDYKNLDYKKPRKEREGRSIINSMDFVEKAEDEENKSREWFESFQEFLDSINYADEESEEKVREEQKPEKEDIKEKINKMLQQWGNT